jgi:hypothetical protein
MHGRTYLAWQEEGDLSACVDSLQASIVSRPLAAQATTGLVFLVCVFTDHRQAGRSSLSHRQGAFVKVQIYVYCR